MTENERLEKIYKNSLVQIITNMDENASIDKMKIINLVRNYAYLLLCKEYNLNGKKPNIDFFDDEYIEGYFDYNSLKIVLGSTSFTKRENIIEDIDTIVHEMRHYAQFVATRKDKETINNSKVTLPQSTQLVNAMALNSLTSDELEKLVLRDEKILFKYSTNYNKYFYYLNKFYYLREVELDARSFSLSTLYDLLVDIDKSKFNERQLKNLDYFLDCAEKVFEDEQEALFNSEANFAICKQGINKDIVKLQSTIIKKCPYIFDAIANNFDRKMYADEMMNFDVSESLSQSLVYVYNDKLAHKLVKSYLNVINNDPATADICGYMNQMVSIYIYTDFEFTKEELQEFVGNNNKDTIQLYNLMKKNKKEYKEYMTEEEKQF